MSSGDTPVSLLEVTLESKPRMAAKGIPKFWANTSLAALSALSAEVWTRIDPSGWIFSLSIAAGSHTPEGIFLILLTILAT